MKKPAEAACQDSDSSNTLRIPRLSDIHINLISGTSAGAANAALLNPWDRALYLAVKNHRSFFRWDNFKHPYHGFMHAGVQRIINGGFYFMFQGEIRDKFAPRLQENFGWDETQIQFAIGLGAGMINGVCNSPPTLIKYKRWGKDGATFMGTTKKLWCAGGLKIFFEGTPDMLLRDMTFGVVYEMTRHQLHSTICIHSDLNETAN